MLNFSLLALLFAASSLLFSLVRSLIISFHHVRRARQLGCEPPVPRRRTKNKLLPLGIDVILRFNEADRHGRVPDEFAAVYAEQKADTFASWTFGRRQVLTSNPRNIQALLATQFRDFQLGDLRRNNFFPMLGMGIFTADGRAWEHSRALLRPQFARHQVADLDLEETHVQHLLRHLQPTVGDRWTNPVDLSPLFFRLTIDSATEFLFGQSVLSQLQALPDANRLQDAAFDFKSLADSFDRATAALGIRGRLGDLFWLYNPKSFREDCKTIHQFADHFVHQALRRVEEEEKTKSAIEDTSGEKTKKRYVFLHALIKETKDPIELRSQLLHLLLAGRDTTAGLLGWTCWNLARHPAVFDKLRRAILETFGTYEHPRDITFERLKSCSYLQYTLNETLRLYPSVPFNSRQATRDTTLPCGGGPDGSAPVYIRKGECVGYSVYVMQRRKDLWGDDPERFVPERWASRRPGWEYLPFNGGPRICLGQQFALTEAGYVLTRLVQRFDRIEPCLPVSMEEPRHQYSVTSAPKEVLVRLRVAGEDR